MTRYDDYMSPIGIMDTIGGVRLRDNLSGVNTGKKYQKGVAQYTLDGVFVKEYASVTQAAQAMGVNGASIQAVLNGRSKSCKGYKWKRP